MYHYTVSFWDEVDKIAKTESGFVAAKRYGAATNKLVDYYGTDNIYSISIYEVMNPICEEEITEVLKEKNKNE